MQKIAFGTLRFIELFSESEEGKKQEYAGYINVFNLQDSVGDEYIVVGSFNGMTPLLQTQQGTGRPIVTVEPGEKKTIRLANNKAELLAIISRIREIWEPYATEMFLPRTAEIMSQYKNFVSRLKEIPDIDFAYWIDFAFKELDIRYEV